MLFARRYEVADDGFIGGGGFGRVYRALDQTQNQIVALKLLMPGSAPGYAFREAQELTRLGGDFILRVHNAHVHQDVPYIVTELAPLGSAADVLRGTRGVAVDRAVTWVRHLLAGLGVCHSARPALIHRDIKPANLFLQSHDHAQLGDFGLVETPDDGGFVPPGGTPSYMPPETWTEGRLTVRSDIYCVGLTAWELLTGTHPFRSVPFHELSGAIVAGVRTRLRDEAPHVPANIARIVERAVSVDPVDRFASADEMDRAFGRLPAPGRVWQEEADDDPDVRRWVSDRPAPALEVVARLVDDRTVDVETRRRRGAASRILDGCFSTTPRRTAVELRRRVFDAF